MGAKRGRPLARGPTALAPSWFCLASSAHLSQQPSGAHLLGSHTQAWWALCPSTRVNAWVFGGEMGACIGARSPHDTHLEPATSPTTWRHCLHQ
jgi:hypothetical protein